jgi:metal-responsive CopG/Arc/MetJ family transcriptional regulator
MIRAKQINVSMRPEVINQLDKLCEASGVNRSALLSVLVTKERGQNEQ